MSQSACTAPEALVKLLAVDRRRLILAQVAEHTWVTTRELRDLTRVSAATITRDLRYLAAHRQLHRVHGGAVSLDGGSSVGAGTDELLRN